VLALLESELKTRSALSDSACEASRCSFFFKLWKNELFWLKNLLVDRRFTLKRCIVLQDDSLIRYPFEPTVREEVAAEEDKVGRLRPCSAAITNSKAHVNVS